MFEGTQCSDFATVLVVFFFLAEIDIPVQVIHNVLCCVEFQDCTLCKSYFWLVCFYPFLQNRLEHKSFKYCI